MIEATQEETTKESKQKYEQDFTFGVKNEYVAAYHKAQAVKTAKDQLVQATEAYSQYQEQLKKAAQQLKEGILTQANYDEMAAEEKHHLAAIGLASANVANKTKLFLASAGSAVASGSSLGFGLDLQADAEKTMEQFLSKKITGKGSKLRAGSTEVRTDGDFRMRGSELESAEVDIEANNVLLEASVGSSSSKKTADKVGGNLTVGVSPSLAAPVNAVNLSAYAENTTGNGQETTYTNSTIKTRNFKVKTQKDFISKGSQVQAEQITGQIGGKLHVETLQNTKKSEQNTKGVNAGLGFGAGSVSPSLGGTYGREKEHGQWSEEQSGLFSQGLLDLAVKGKTELIGGAIRSASNELKLETAQVVHQDLDGFQTSSRVNLHASVGMTATSGGNSYNGSGSLDYGTSTARQKVLAGIGSGTIIETGTSSPTNIRRTVAEGPTTYQDTRVNLSVDSETIKLVADPVKAAKEAYEDSKKIYTAAEGIVETTVKSHKYGVIGTLKQYQNNFVDLQTITNLAENEEHAEKINKATELQAQKLESTLDKQFDYQQSQGGIAEKDRARVLLYQGDDKEIKKSKTASNLTNYKGGYNQDKNQVYVNTERTDISNGADIQRVLFTEQQRKENHHSRLLNKLSDNQQKDVAYDRGDRAAKLWERFSEPVSKSKPEAVKAWNEQHRASLVENNKLIGGIDGSQVRPRRYRVDIATKDGDNAIAKYSDEGGDETQFYDKGYYKSVLDKDGNPVIGPNGEQQKEFVTITTDTIPGISLNLFPFFATKHSTTTLLHMPIDGAQVDGVMLFPKSPPSNIEGSNSMLEPGTYDLSDNHGPNYPRALLISRENPALGENKLYEKQARLIHAGNHFANTTGCGLPGYRFKKDSTLYKKVKHKDGTEEMKLVVDDKGNAIKDTLIIGPKGGKNKDGKKVDLPSSTKLKELKKVIKSFGKDKKGKYKIKMVVSSLVQVNQELKPIEIEKKVDQKQ